MWTGFKNGKVSSESRHENYTYTYIRIYDAIIGVYLLKEMKNSLTFQDSVQCQVDFFVSSRKLTYHEILFGSFRERNH